jgi:predicted RNase H-like HicB family nuclease
MTTTYDVTVSREGKWWMVDIPALDGLTQARRLAEAGQMAREWIALTTDSNIDDIAVNVTVERVGDVDVSGQLDEIRRQREQAAEMEREALAHTAALAKALAAQDVPVRDIGAALGVSFQRAHQLVQAA